MKCFKLLILAYLLIINLFLMGFDGQKALNNIKFHYNLISAEDYTAAVNKRDFFCDKTLSFKGTTHYEACCMALGYKKVAWIEAEEFVGTIAKDVDLDYILKNNIFYYAELRLDNNKIQLVYSQDGRHEALLLIKYFLHLHSNNMPIYQDSGDMEIDYLTGRCLGYSYEDIELYFQRIAFMNKFSCQPDKKLEEFNLFIKEDWQSYGAIQFKQAKNNIDFWINQNSSTGQLEKDIQILKKDVSVDYLTYDRPLKIFLWKYSQRFTNKIMGSLAETLYNWIVI